MLARSGVKRGFSRLSDRVGAGENPFVGQRMITEPGTTNVLVPLGSQFVFAEVLGAGGNCGASNASKGGGAAGSDAIFSVTKEESLAVSIPGSSNSFGIVYPPTTVSQAGSIKVSANGGTYSDPFASGIAAGKYPSIVVDNGNVPGKGGGRLAGQPPGGSAHGAGHGAGAWGDGGANDGGGRAVACLTFFRTYDAAFAFANSLYGGNWQP